MQFLVSRYGTVLTGAVGSRAQNSSSLAEVNVAPPAAAASSRRARAPSQTRAALAALLGGIANTSSKSSPPPPAPPQCQTGRDVRQQPARAAPAAAVVAANHAAAARLPSSPSPVVSHGAYAVAANAAASATAAGSNISVKRPWHPRRHRARPPGSTVAMSMLLLPSPPPLALPGSRVARTQNAPSSAPAQSTCGAMSKSSGKSKPAPSVRRRRACAAVTRRRATSNRTQSHGPAASLTTLGPRSSTTTFCTALTTSHAVVGELVSTAKLSTFLPTNTCSWTCAGGTTGPGSMTV